MKIRPLPEWPSAWRKRRGKSQSRNGQGLLRFSSTNRSVAIDSWLVSRIRAGWSPMAIVAASGGTISLRTAYRWVAEFERLEDVAVGGYTAEFVIRRNAPPVRVSEWRVNA